MPRAFSRIIARLPDAVRRSAPTVTVLTLFGVFFVARPAFAIGLTEIETFIAQIITAIAAMFGYVFTQALLFLTDLLVSVAGYNGFATSEAVNRGWVIVRDLTNMFFILVMLIIAFGTILGVEEYSYKRMLPRLLIMAVVINFSKVICGLLIDFSQVVMLTFVNGFSAIAGGNFVQMFQVEAAYDVVGERAEAVADSAAAWETALSFILAALLMLIAAVAVFIMTMMLVARIVMLWLLIVLSPLAFFLSAFPKGRAAEAYGKWWSMFGNYVVIGPFIAFFLWLSLAVTGGGDIAGEMNIIGSEGTALGVSRLGSRQEFFSFIIGLALLMGGMSLSAQFGTMGGGMMSGAASWFQQQGANAIRKPLSGAARLAGRQARLAEANVYARTGLRVPRPAEWGKGTEKRIEDLQARGRATAVAAARGGGFRGAAVGLVGATDEMARRAGVLGVAGALVARPFLAAVRGKRGQATGLADADTYLRNAAVAQSDADAAKGQREGAERGKDLELETIRAKQAELDALEAPEISLDMETLSRQRDFFAAQPPEVGAKPAAALDSVLSKGERGETLTAADISDLQRAGISSPEIRAASRDVAAYDELAAPIRGEIAAAQGKVKDADGDINRFGNAEAAAMARVGKWTQGADRARIKGFAPEVPKHAMDAASSSAMLDEALRTKDRDLIKSLVQKIANDNNVDDVLDLKKLGKGRDGLKRLAGELEKGGLSNQESMTALAELDSVMKAKGNTEYSGNVKGGAGGRLRWTSDAEYQESRGKGGEKGSMHGKLQNASNTSLFERSVRDPQTGGTTKAIDAAGAALIARHIGDIVKVTSERKMSGDMMSFFTANEKKVVDAVRDAGVKDEAAIKRLTDAIGDMKKQMGDLAPKIGDVIRTVEKNRATRKP